MNCSLTNFDSVHCRVGVPVPGIPIDRVAIDRDSRSGISLDPIASEIEILSRSNRNLDRKFDRSVFPAKSDLVVSAHMSKAPLCVWGWVDKYP